MKELLSKFFAEVGYHIHSGSVLGIENDFQLKVYYRILKDALNNDDCIVSKKRREEMKKELGEFK